jgi:cytochrome c5
MRGEVHGVLRSCVIASVLLTLTLGGCRTVDIGGQADRDPELKAIVGSAEAADIAALPEGVGKTIVAERCLLCHGAALVTQQRKDAAAWGRTVAQMRTWGTPIQDEDQTALVAYLTEHFGSAAVRR